MNRRVVEVPETDAECRAKDEILVNLGRIDACQFQTEYCVLDHVVMDCRVDAVLYVDAAITSRQYIVMDVMTAHVAAR